MNPTGFKRVIYRLNLSAIILSTAIGISILVIGLPIGLFNKFVQARAESCFEENFRDYELEYEKKRDWKDNNHVGAEFQKSGEPVFLFSRYTNGLVGPKTSEERLKKLCNIRWLHLQNVGRPDQITNVFSDSTILDVKSLTTPFYISMILFGIALLLFIVGKWVAWLFKP